MGSAPLVIEYATPAHLSAPHTGPRQGPANADAGWSWQAYSAGSGVSPFCEVGSAIIAWPSASVPPVVDAHLQAALSSLAQPRVFLEGKRLYILHLHLSQRARVSAYG